MPRRPAAAVRFLIAIAPVKKFAVAHAQHGPIDPNWVNTTTPLKWQRIAGAPKDVKTRTAEATTVILYPEGQYIEIHATLYREGDSPIMIPGNDGLLIRTGTWSRTDDRAIRIQSHEALRDKILLACNSAASASSIFCHPSTEIENCALRGFSTAQLAKAILCKRLVIQPIRLPLNLKSLEARAGEGFNAASSQ
jgi:hypothetical protein